MIPAEPALPQGEGAPVNTETDFLSFAQGALPLFIAGTGAELKVGPEQSLKAIDGNVSGFILTPKPGDENTHTELTYELPAPTTFQRFSVPNILETPSPSQTFIKKIDVFGSNAGPEDGFELLASASLETHTQKGQVTTFDATLSTPVKWVKVSLAGGINIERDKTFFEFSELSGFGSQEPVPLNEGFTGIWKGRGVLLETAQSGALVSGCYDRTGDLTGAVTGNVLKATGVDRDDGTLSAFILTVDAEGNLRGLRSANGAPFRTYSGDPAPEGTQTECSEPEEAILGCNSIVYGINFAYDSDEILPESEFVLEDLYLGLKESGATKIIVEGHTSSEGSEAYNLDLSDRRANSVVSALASKGWTPPIYPPLVKAKPSQ